MKHYGCFCFLPSAFYLLYFAFCILLSAFCILPSSIAPWHSPPPPPPLLRRYPHYCENSSIHGRKLGLLGSFCFNQLRRVKEAFGSELGLDHQLLTLFNQGRTAESFAIK